MARPDNRPPQAPHGPRPPHVATSATKAPGSPRANVARTEVVLPTQRRRTRDWRQHWSKSAPLVWNKVMLILGRSTVIGAPVTEEQRQRLGVYRLKTWFERGMLCLAPAREPIPAKG